MSSIMQSPSPRKARKAHEGSTPADGQENTGSPLGKSKPSSPKRRGLSERNANVLAAGLEVGNELAPMDVEVAAAPASSSADLGGSRLLAWLGGRPVVEKWAGAIDGPYGTAKLLQLREGRGLCVEPGSGIMTGQNIILEYIPRAYFSEFWHEHLLQLEPGRRTVAATTGCLRTT